MRGRRRVLAVALALAMAVVPAMASGAGGGDGAITGERDDVRWSGVAPVVTSDVQSVLVALGSNAWTRPGGVQIGIRWDSEDDDLELRVTAPDGAVYSSEGIVSTAESVLVPSAPDGVYTVEVTSAGGPGVAYQGVAQVERDVRAKPARRLLPDLVSLPARNLHFAVGAYLVNPVEGGLGANSCYPEEMIEQGARRCLRFDQIIENVGDGPFELRYKLPPEDAHPSGEPNLVTFENLVQRIFWSDGRGPEERVADTYEFHPAHAHFHYRNFAVSSLWRVEADGTKTFAAGGRKNGFCMVDVENSWFGRRGDAARTYRPPACLAPTQGDENINGISRGWADVYNWFLPDQYIEVSHLTDGDYVLETVSDPAGTVVEADDTNNCSAVLITLSHQVTKAALGPSLGPC